MDADGGVGGGAGVDLGIGLFLDRGDDDGETVGARGVEQQERKASVAGDEAEALRAVLDRFVVIGRLGDGSGGIDRIAHTRLPAYLITPRELLAMKSAR